MIRPAAAKAAPQAPAWFRWLVALSLLGMFLVAMGYAIASNVRDEDRGERYYRVAEILRKLKPIHEPKLPPRPDDWLATQWEMGQTFDQYAHGEPILPEGDRKTIAALAIGEFSPEQREIVDLTTEFLGLYYGLPARQLEPVEDGVVPQFARREWGWRQYSTPFILQRVLKPRLPDDAMFLVGFTTTDLWPGRDGWNFVFGQASLQSRVGVWSLKRFGDPSKSKAEYQTALLHSLKTASHEAGHMFGIKHCVEYECAMGGSMSLDEAARRPLEVCPECVAKIVWATGVDPKKRFQDLAEFCGRNGLAKERAFYEKSLERLEARD